MIKAASERGVTNLWHAAHHEAQLRCFVYSGHRSSDDPLHMPQWQQRHCKSNLAHVQLRSPRARKSISHGKTAAWFQPHCGVPGQLEIGWYLNRAGVLTVEPPVPKMDSGQLPESGFVRIVDKERAWHRLASSPPMLPAADPIADLERREC